MSRFFAVTVAVLAIASCLRLVLAQRGSPEGDLRAEQDRIACELDDQLIEQFKGTVRERHGVARGYG